MIFSPILEDKKIATTDNILANTDENIANTDDILANTDENIANTDNSFANILQRKNSPTQMIFSPTKTKTLHAYYK